MKVFSVLLLALVIVGSGYLWWSGADERHSGQGPALGETTAPANKSEAAGVADVVAPPSGPVASGTPGKATAVAVTREQEIAALEKEQELLQMAQEYEDVRADPEKRLAHRQAMKEKLAAYSEAVLPIALEKARAAQQ